MSVAVLGAQGQVGGDLAYWLELQGKKTRAFTREEADFLKPHLVIRALEKLKPSVVFNAAAYTQVDLAEKEQEQAFKINGEAPGLIAEWCAKRNIPFIHYSTDYVFSGLGNRPWTENDPTAPLSVYGKSKLAGEEAVQKAGGKFLIFRTSWVYAPEGKNFLNTMIRLGSEREELRIVSDQIGAPTLSRHLAQASLQALEKSLGFGVFPVGIYHICNLGETNWFHFAKEIFSEARAQGLELKVKQVQPITASEYPTPAQRPLNSRLSALKIFDTFGIELPHWREALKECMELRQ